MEKTETKKSGIKDLFEWLDIVISSVLAVVLIFTFLFRIVSIEGASMENTLLNNERVVISNLFYTPKRGDIIVISRNTQNKINVSDSQSPIIKRVIAVEGQTVDIKEDGYVYVNNVKLDEPYIKDYEIVPNSTVDLYDVSFPLVVEKDCVFVLGDNRRESLDSRAQSIGQINKKYILGKAIFRVFPFNKIGGIS